MTWLQGWRARRRQHNVLHRYAGDGDTTAYLNQALPESCTHEHWAWHQSPFGDPEWSQCLDCGEYGVDVAGRPDHDNGDLADPPTTPKHRKPPHA